METEQAQAGAVVEPVEEKPSQPVSETVSTEKVKASEKTYSEQELRAMQSLKDKADAKAQKLEKELENLRKADLQRKLESRQKEIQSFEGEPDEQARVKRKHALEDSLQELESKNQELSDAVGRKYDNAMQLAEQYNLDLAAARELMAADTPKEMELLAQLKVAENKKVQPPEETPSIKPDSGMSDAGADSEDAFQRDWNAGIIPATKENIDRIQKILNK